jgi:hypothetical protein
LYATIFSTKWLSVPLSIPPVVNRPKDQDKEAFWHYQAANSHVIVGTDAARLAETSPVWGGGWTAKRINQPYYAWGEYDLVTFAEYARRTFTDMLPCDLALLDQINFFEAIVVVLACDTILRSLPADRPPHIVLFVWCDNTSAIAWLTKFKNHHPIINFVLQVWSRLQVSFDATINMGHIRGFLNKDPDAISRHFDVQDGLLIKESLSHILRHHSLPPWFQDLLTCSMQPSTTAWQSVADSLIKLAQTL